MTKKPKPETPHQRFDRAMGVILAAPKGKAGKPKDRSKKKPKG